MTKNRRTTLKTIADELGVSITLVSRVLNGQAPKYRISKKTAESVIRVAEELNFSPNHIARGLVLRKTSTIGLLIPDISNPFFSDIARHVSAEVRKLGYSIILCVSEEDTDIENDMLSILQSRMIDGLIVSPVGLSEDHLIQLHKSGLPLVIVDRHFDDVELTYVTSDNFKGAYEGTCHLIDHGHSDIAFIQGTPGSSTNVERRRGYEAALEEFNIPIVDNSIVGDKFSERNGYLETKLLLKRKNPPTAIFLANNLIALGALRAFDEEEVEIPQDISIISFDDFPYSPYLKTPLTAIAQQTAEMGQMAVKLLFNQIEQQGNCESQAIMLPTTLMERGSVGGLRGKIKIVSLKKGGDTEDKQKVVDLPNKQSKSIMYSAIHDNV